jgi:cytochrome c oxidase assembly factor 6
MGWFSSSPVDTSGVKKTEGGAFESPSRSNRKQCYAARDVFFECLDKNNILDSINSKAGRDKAASFCGQFDKEFESNCAHSWVCGILVHLGWAFSQLQAQRDLKVSILHYE